MNSHLQPQLDSLALLLTHVQRGAFALALYSHAETRCEVMKALRQRLSRTVHEVALSADRRNPIDLIRALHPKSGDVVCLYDLEPAFPEALNYLDLQREVLVDMEISLVCWVLPYEYSAIQNVAPNFFVFCSGSFYFLTNVSAPEVAVTASRSPRVFISYSFDRTDTKERVLELSNRLRRDGIDCRIDQYEINPTEGWARWIERQNKEADFVLVVCSENYLRRSQGGFGERGQSVQSEGGAVRAWKGEQIRQLHQALASAFPSRAELEIMLFQEMDERLNLIVGATNLTETIFSLIMWAESRGRLEELVEAAYRANPGNPELSVFVTQHLRNSKAELDQTLTNYVPIVFSREDIATIPEWLSGFTFYDLSSKGGYAELYKRLTGREYDKSVVQDSVFKGNRTNANTPNPFVWRSGIRTPEAFFNRVRELSNLHNFLTVQGACQVVGERRIGKSSLLLHVQHIAAEWDSLFAVAYVDLQDSQCETLSDWLRVVARQWEWESVPQKLSEFSERVEEMIRGQKRKPVLCLDEFEQFAAQRGEFSSAFFLNLRACAGKGMAILTASSKPLKDLTNPGDPTSPFFNVFHPIPLKSFSEPDAEDFVNMPRPGVPPFTREEREQILKFARCHPLALQVACYHVLEAKRYGDSLPTALHAAEDELRAMLPSW